MDTPCEDSHYWWNWILQAATSVNILSSKDFTKMLFAWIISNLCVMLAITKQVCNGEFPFS